MLLIKIERNLISRVLCATTGRGSNESLPKTANAFLAFFLFFVLVDYETGEMASYTSATPTPTVPSLS